MNPHKEIATAFLRLVVAGEISQAFEHYAAKDFRHHNMYSSGDAAALQQGMQENHERFPHKEFEIQRVIAEGDLVAAHSRIKLAPEGPELAVVHIFRFHEGRIAELWDVAQPVPADSQNENGMF